jgi:hypothetical protein
MIKLKQLINEASKMDLVDLNSYLANLPTDEWKQWFSQFPEMLQREFAVELSTIQPGDFDFFRNMKLKSKKPISMSTRTLLKDPKNVIYVSMMPDEVINHINKLWKLNVKQTKVLDKNPNRFFEYSKMPSSTAKPSVMVNGEIIHGVGRFIAALIRGDEHLMVWDLIK